ncbi:MAG: hypothetical protein JO214_04060 [Frankiaceae bacterium]|nr:hypothetical protein [Frankiaceae bacterium]
MPTTEAESTRIALLRGASVLLVVAIAVAGGVIAVDHHQRTATFLYWSAQTGGSSEHGQHDRAWVETHRRLVLADGWQACAWLAAQPPAPPDATVATDGIEQIALRYRAGLASGPFRPLAPANRVRIALNAWAHLCPGTGSGKYVSYPGD